MDDLFPGPAWALPAGARGGLGFGYSFRGDDPLAREPVRHAAGYAPFVAFAVSEGADPVVLAGDLAAFGAFVQVHREALSGRGLAEAASVFLGNLLAVVHPRASWRTTSEPEVGTEAVSMPVRGAFASMRDIPEFAARMAAELPERWAEADLQHDQELLAVAAARTAADDAVLADAPEFFAPLVVTGPFLDLHGEPIAYGERWEYPAGPPDDAYSRVTHPERFGPLIDAAEALLVHLERWYDVERSSTEDGAVVLRPRRGAPIRIGFTDFPAVHLRAGLLLDEMVPDCGCDACDETAADAIQSLVRTVLGVVSGGFVERVPHSGEPGAVSLRLADGGGSDGARNALPDDPLVEPAEVVALGGAAWPAWPRRT